MNRNMRLTALTMLLLAALFVAGCSPIGSMAALNMGDAMAEGSSGEMEGESEEMTMEGDGAMATVATRSLRVRQSPDAESEVVSGVREGETYKVVEISEDGQWVQIAIADAPDGNGWVSANFVTVNGALEGSTGDALIIEPTPVPAEEAMEGESMEEEAMEESAPPAPPEAGYATVYTDGTRLRVRAEPDTEAEIVGYVYSDETYQVLAVSNDGTWINIAGSTDAETDNPNGGWVSAEFLVIGE